jgi:hypothetical protein
MIPAFLWGMVAVGWVTCYPRGLPSLNPNGALRVTHPTGWVVRNELVVFIFETDYFTTLSFVWSADTCG